MSSSLTRREFLNSALWGSLAIAGAPVVVSAARRVRENKGQIPSRIVEVQGPPEKALHALIEELGGIDQFVRSGDTVLIKPNMSFPNTPDRATTTDPRLVKTMLTMCLNAGARRVIVADHPMRPTRICIERTGMQAACEGVKEVYLLGAESEGMYQTVALDNCKELHQVKVLKAFVDADVLINVPKMKSHGATTVSLGTKGNMGLIWDRSSFHVRLDLNQAIADLNTYIRADLTIIDATRVLTAGGPLGPGPVEDLNSLIGGTDPVAVDAYGAERVQWYGRSFSSTQIAHLVACHQRGIGEIDLDRVAIQRRNLSKT